MSSLKKFEYNNDDENENEGAMKMCKKQIAYISCMVTKTTMIKTGMVKLEDTLKMTMIKAKMMTQCKVYWI